MNYEQFELKVKHLETISKNNPKAYKFKVRLVSLLGYGYIFLVVLLMLAIIGGLVYVTVFLDLNTTLIRKIVFPLIILVFLILKSLYIKFDKPEGHYLNRIEGNQLYELTDNLVNQLNSSKIHQIVLTNEMNAALYQHPRLGMFGLYQNYLILGIPLLGSVSSDELKTIIAHELGHLSGNHGKFGAKMYRNNQTWENIMKNLETNESKSTFLFKKFLKFYLPIFDAYTFVLRRENEYEADRLAVQITNTSIFTSSLMKLNVSSQIENQDYLKTIYRQVKDIDQPIDHYFEGLFNFYKNQTTHEQIRNYINHALQKETNATDTHPSLKDRIQAIGGNPNMVISYQESALNVLLPNKKEDLLFALNNGWKQHVQKWWIEKYEYYQKAKARYNEIIQKEINETINLDEQSEKAELIELLEEDYNKSLEIYKSILSNNEKNINAKFNIGRLLLKKHDSNGMNIIEECTKEDIRFTKEGCTLIYYYLTDLGQLEEAKAYYERAVEFSQILELAKKERDHVGFSEKYIEHELHGNVLTNLVNQFGEYNQIETVYLIKKDVQYLKDYPLYVLGVKLNGLTLDKQRNYVNDLAKELTVPGEFFVVPLTPSNAKLEDVMKTISNAQIYKK